MIINSTEKKKKEKEWEVSVAEDSSGNFSLGEWSWKNLLRSWLLNTDQNAVRKQTIQLWIRVFQAEETVSAEPWSERVLSKPEQSVRLELS